MEQASGASCDTCAYFFYDDEYEEYVCDINMDEDDYGRLVNSGFKGCPYYRDGDEYKVVRHQI
jgi:hypothetical protein